VPLLDFERIAFHLAPIAVIGVIWIVVRPSLPDTIRGMRYRLRTLLILLAVAPPIVAGLSIRDPLLFVVAVFAAVGVPMAIALCEVLNGSEDR
jgi:hypothetical protein